MQWLPPGLLRCLLTGQQFADCPLHLAGGRAVLDLDELQVGNEKIAAFSRNRRRGEGADVSGFLAQ